MSKDRRAYHAAYRLANPEKAKVRREKFLAAHPGKDAEYSATYRQRHPNRRKASTAAYRAENLEAERITHAKWASANKGRLAAKAAGRRAQKIQATPAWVNWEEIAAIYADAQARTAATGQPYHVDHIVPLKSKLVCGLHCPANLRVIPGVENLTKGNRSWPDMP